METIKVKAKDPNGENAVYITLGNYTVTFIADVYDKLNHMVKKKFIVTGVGADGDYLDPYYYARKYVEYLYSGYLFNTVLISVQNDDVE